MKVIAQNRDIIYSNSCGCSNADGYLNVDGNSTSATILAFQKFANKKGFKDSSGKPLVENGKWDRNTNQAAALYGKEFDMLVASDAIRIPVKTENTGVASIAKGEPNPNGTTAETKKDEPKKNGIMDTVTALFKKDETNPPVSATKTPEQEKAEKKKKMIKIALIAGGAIALTTIIILIARKKK